MKNQQTEKAIMPQTSQPHNHYKTTQVMEQNHNKSWKIQSRASHPQLRHTSNAVTKDNPIELVEKTYHTHQTMSNFSQNTAPTTNIHTFKAGVALNSMMKREKNTKYSKAPDEGALGTHRNNRWENMKKRAPQDKAIKR